MTGKDYLGSKKIILSGHFLNILCIFYTKLLPIHLHYLLSYMSNLLFIFIYDELLSVYAICSFTNYLFLLMRTGAEAKRVFDDAQKLLSKIISQGSLQARGVVAFFPANSNGDDIELYEDDSRSKVMTKLFGLRQQVKYLISR